MNSGILDWCCEFDPPSTKKNNRQDHDLAELLWRNGQVVLNSQANRKPSPNRSDARQDDLLAREGLSSWNACNPIPDEEMVSWIHHPVVDSFENEFCSQFFGELPEEEKALNVGMFPGSSQQHSMRTAAVSDISQGQMTSPRFHFPDPTRQDETRPTSLQMNGQQGSGKLCQVDVRECSAMTVGSSRCGSNQIPNDFHDQSRASSNGVATTGAISAGLVMEGDCNMLSLSQTEGTTTVILEPTLTSSGGSGSSFGAIAKPCVDASIGHKRKGRGGKETECQSETLEIELAGGKKSTTRSSGSTRRSRAAEVHNLSERRRRDRINKKMKTLRELIPHCNKTDKASMLDEAIEYLKSLQLQLQVMWMGGGMAAMMFPGAQPYMSSMGMTMHPNMHMPRIPTVDQSLPPVSQSMSQGTFSPTPVMNPMILQNQMAGYMAMHRIQTPQPAKMFKSVRQVARHNQTNSQPRDHSGGATDGS